MSDSYKSNGKCRKAYIRVSNNCHDNCLNGLSTMVDEDDPDNEKEAMICSRSLHHQEQMPKDE